ncbi:cytochrome P450 [Catenuloplanes japonicus]|uniref:cytochrome P450 n=1 Tax=Catenuloplanes japonicus TaxID=33876 RepID=UPI0018DC6404|nr:cytochrome P450 [Catenuloplanes japonicus]
MRAADRIVQVDGWLPGGTLAPMWLLTRHDHVRELLAHPDTSTSPAMIGDAQPGFFIFSDPPEHTRLRKVLASAFTARRIARMRPYVARSVDGLLDRLEAAAQPVDLVAQFATPLPTMVICELLGVPYADRDAFQQLSVELIATSDPRRREAGMAEMSGYMMELIAGQRRAPGPGVIGALVRDEKAGLTDEEIAGIGNLLLTAGHVTTASALGSGLVLLMTYPRQADLVREEPDVTASAVEEILRFLTVETGGVPRRATRDIDLGGNLIRAGDIVRVMLPAANRDPALTPDPDQFDVTRAPTRHLAFGHGLHHCLGAPLARLEMAVAIPALLRRFPAMRPAEPLDGLPFRNAAVLRLPVHLR